MKYYTKVMSKIIQLLMDEDFKDLNKTVDVLFNDDIGQYKAESHGSRIKLCRIHDDEMINVYSRNILEAYTKPFIRYSNDKELIYKIFTASHELGHIFSSSMMNKNDRFMNVALSAVVTSFESTMYEVVDGKYDDNTIINMQISHRFKPNEVEADAYAISRLPYILTMLSNRKDIKFKKYNKLERDISSDNIRLILNDIVPKIFKVKEIKSNKQGETRIKYLTASRSQSRMQDNLDILEGTYLDIFLKYMVDDVDITIAKKVFYALLWYSKDFFIDELGVAYAGNLITQVRNTIHKLSIYTKKYNKELYVLLLYNGAFTMFPYVWEELLKLKENKNEDMG